MTAHPPHPHPPSAGPVSEHDDHGSGHHGPQPPSAEELAESLAARRAVALAIGKPLGTALLIVGCGWTLALLGAGNLVVLPLGIMTAAHGLGMLAVARDLRDAT